jgi:FkbM family methyltransferase
MTAAIRPPFYEGQIEVSTTCERGEQVVIAQASVVNVQKLSSAVRGLVRRSGHDITPFPIPAWFQQREHLLPMLKALRINCVLDVGAHTGEFAQFMRSIGYQGEILSFEPVSENFQVVSALAERDCRWTVHQVALGSEEGECEINVLKATELCSFLTPNEYCAEHFGTEAAVRKRERVRVRTLASVLDGYRDKLSQWRIFLKVDTQGRDLDVIEGGRKHLSTVQMIQTELSLRPIYRGMPGYTEVLTRLKELGFQPTGFFPITHDKDLRLIEMDCVLVADDARMELAN